MFKALLLAVVAAALAVVPAYAKSSAVRLKGEVGPGFTIEVTKAGKDVKTLRHGTYRIVVEDKSSAHNFHLFGPGVSKTTSVPFTGKRTWTVRLKKGCYTYQCDVHAANGMKGSFRVT